MQFKFDANQSFQVRAIESVAALLSGQTASVSKEAALAGRKRFNPTA